MVEQVFLAVLAVLLITAAVCDIRSYTIPDSLNIAIALLYALYALQLNPPLSALAYEFAAAGLVFLLGFFLFMRGLFGGGDVKMLAAVALWVGPIGVPRLLILMSLTGGLLALTLLGFRRWRQSSPAPLDRRIPYGIAIAAGGIDFCLQRSHLAIW